VVKPGAFKKTIRESRGKVPLLDSHNAFGISGVLGRTIALEEKDDHLYFKAFFSASPSAQDARSKIKEGLINGVSIGYQVVKDKMLATGVRELVELKLWEISMVMFPANPKAVISGVKSDGKTRAEVFAPCPDLSRVFDEQLAFRRWMDFCAKGIAFREWDRPTLELFSKGFLSVDPDSPTRDGMFKHLIVDIVDGLPHIIRFMHKI